MKLNCKNTPIVCVCVCVCVFFLFVTVTSGRTWLKTEFGRSF